jgi:exodeoxyribonuclease VII large subunit
VRTVLYPVRVQGKGAEHEIARAVTRMGHPETYNLPRCEVLIVGRGGGSLEDLWCFNEEVVARAIAACPIPVISAVGHEIDFTIADFAADVRAATPSAAAELAVPDGEELRARLRVLDGRLARATHGRIERLALQLDGFRRGVLGRGGERLLREPWLRVDALRLRLANSLRERIGDCVMRLGEARVRHRAHHPALELQRRLELLDSLRAALLRAAREDLRQRAQRLTRAAGMLRTLGPESAFQRGFTITLDEQGRVVRSAEALQPGDLLRTKFSDGEAQSRVVAGGGAREP